MPRLTWKEVLWPTVSGLFWATVRSTLSFVLLAVTMSLLLDGFILLWPWHTRIPDIAIYLHVNIREIYQLFGQCYMFGTAVYLLLCVKGVVQALERGHCLATNEKPPGTHTSANMLVGRSKLLEASPVVFENGVDEFRANDWPNDNLVGTIACVEQSRVGRHSGDGIRRCYLDSHQMNTIVFHLPSHGLLPQYFNLRLDASMPPETMMAETEPLLTKALDANKDLFVVIDGTVDLIEGLYESPRTFGSHLVQCIISTHRQQLQSRNKTHQPRVRAVGVYKGKTWDLFEGESPVERKLLTGRGAQSLASFSTKIVGAGDDLIIQDIGRAFSMRYIASSRNGYRQTRRGNFVLCITTDIPTPQVAENESKLLTLSTLVVVPGPPSQDLSDRESLSKYLGKAARGSVMQDKHPKSMLTDVVSRFAHDSCKVLHVLHVSEYGLVSAAEAIQFRRRLLREAASDDAAGEETPGSATLSPSLEPHVA